MEASVCSRSGTPPFLGLDGLVQPFRPATSLHGTAGMFVNDDNLAILYDVIHITLEQGMVRSAALT